MAQSPFVQFIISSTEYSVIDGKIQAFGAEYVKVMEETYVGGNVQIGLTGYCEEGMPSEICDSEISGNVQLYMNFVPFTLGCDEYTGNYIGGNLQVVKNYINPEDFKDVVDYGISIQHNEINGNLQFF